MKTFKPIWEFYYNSFRAVYYNKFVKYLYISTDFYITSKISGLKKIIF